MKPWFPAPVDGWDETAEILLDSGKRWPEQAVVSDMRWMVDQGVPVPGRPTLRQRWKWEDWEIRKFLANEDLWRDPIRPREPVRRKGTRQQPTSSHQPAPESTSGHQPNDGRTPDIWPDSPAATSSHQPAPGSLHTRGDPPSPSPSPSQTEEQEATASADHHPLSPMHLTNPGTVVSPFFGPPPAVVEAPVEAAVAMAEAPAVEAEEPAEKPKRKRAPKKPKAGPTDGQKAVTDLWADVWRETHEGKSYPWNWIYDRADLQSLLDGVDKDPDGMPLAKEMTRLRLAFITYIAAAKANDPLCKGYGANVHGFRLGFATWMQRADEEADFQAYMAQFGPYKRPEPLWKQWEREDAALIAAGLPPKTKLPRRNMVEVAGSVAWHMRKLEEEAKAGARNVR